jgi:hypothetical protein
VLSFDFGRRSHGAEKCTVEAPRQGQRERPNRYGSSAHDQNHVRGPRCGGASDLRLHLMWSALVWRFPSIFDASAARAEKCTADVLRQPQDRRPSRYGSSEHDRSPIFGTQGGGASDLRLYLMEIALTWCFPPISTQQPHGAEQCSAEALNKLQRERSCRYSSYVHCQSPV